MLIDPFDTCRAEAFGAALGYGEFFRLRDFDECRREEHKLPNSVLVVDSLVLVAPVVKQNVYFASVIRVDDTGAVADG